MPDNLAATISQVGLKQDSGKLINCESSQQQATAASTGWTEAGARLAHQLWKASYSCRIGLASNLAASLGRKLPKPEPGSSVFHKLDQSVDHGSGRFDYARGIG
jgi:hypothetical protein